MLVRLILVAALVTAVSAQTVDSTGRQPEVGRRDSLSWSERRPEDPRHEVAPVVEVEMRERDRLDPGPAAVERAQAGQHTGPAVEEEPALALDEIARLRAAGIRPGGRAADDGEPHRRILPISRRLSDGV